jgi:phytoene dehydrogenase-like protein
VHGAYVSGKRAAKWCLETIQSDDTTDKPVLVVVIGAGAAGISAAETIHKAFNSGPNAVSHKVIIVEALDRLGGRATTVSMGDGIHIDAGGTWLQQYKSNPLVKEAVRLGLTLVPTDFMYPYASCADGAVTVDEINAMVLQIETAAQRYHETVDADSSVMQIIDDLIRPMYQDNPRMLKIIDLTIAEIMADTGIPLNTLSSKYGLEEPSSVGEGDHYIKEGFSALWTGIAEGIDIRYNTPIKNIDWTNAVTLTTLTDEVIVADYCICTIPISVLQDAANNTSNVLSIRPPLPTEHLDALRQMKMAICDKVILRFSDRWWPTSPSGNNILKWYGDGKYGNSFTDMLDATDGVGSPTVVLYMIGADNVANYMDGKTDEEIADTAYDALCKWSATVGHLDP